VVAFKKGLGSGAAAQGLRSGQTGVVTNIIDGDEVTAGQGKSP
jgi:hypothetical protein